MIPRRLVFTVPTIALAAALAACQGGGSSAPPLPGGTPAPGSTTAPATAPPGGATPTPTPTTIATATPTAAPTATPTPAVTPTPTPTAAPQVVKAALPPGTLGVENDPTYGLVAGFTQQSRSQTLAFSPGSQVMIQNIDATTPHTFNVIGTVGTPISFPPNPTFSFTASGGPIGTGFATGAINGGQTVGPFTLVAGTYYIGCAFHYQLSTPMRTVLKVAAGATPGPQAP